MATLSRWPGFGIEFNFYIPSGATYNLIGLHRDAFPAIKQDYTSVYVQDTMTVGNLTANVGLRYDVQGGENLSRTVLANPLFPQLLPAVSYAGGDIGFEWETITPRLGLTYALGAERKTLLRASYSRFADQLGTGQRGCPQPAVRLQLRLLLLQRPQRQRRGRPERGARSTAVTPIDSGNYDPRNGQLLQLQRRGPGLRRADDRRAAVRRRARAAAGVRGRPEPHLPQDHRHPRERAAGVRRRRDLRGQPRPDRPRPPAERLRAPQHHAGSAQRPEPHGHGL